LSTADDKGFNVVRDHGSVSLSASATSNVADHQVDLIGATSVAISFYKIV
jgi:hypothetical protein